MITEPTTNQPGASEIERLRERVEVLRIALWKLRQPFRSDWRAMTEEEKRIANNLAVDETGILRIIDAALRETE